MPAYHSGILSQTGRETFTLPLRPTTSNLTLPLGPQNMMVTSPYNIGVTDVRWDNPKLLPQNNALQIIGVNVYRSINNPYGPYELLNSSPVNVLFYRDQTEEMIVTEDATPTIRHDLEPDGYWRVYAMHRPIIKPGTNGETSDNIEDVQVEIDDGDGSFIVVPAFAISGKTGEIQLISNPVYNPTIEQIIPPRLPWPPNGKIRITYKYLKHDVLSRLQQRIFYKVTTVAVDPNDNSKRIETPIDEMEYRSTFDIEEIDYIWKEAMRRNRWILDQGGERVKIFVRKSMGPRCPDYEETHGQSQNDCPLCFPAGTEITMNDFTRKSIELIKTGDKVITHTGSTGSVVQIMNRNISEEIIEIKSINEIKIKSTINHPFLILRKRDARCLRDNRLNCTGNDRTVCNKKPWVINCCRDISENIQWINAENIQVGDYLLTPIPHNQKTKKFTEDQLKILGYYAAEGNLSKRYENGKRSKEDKRIDFSFNQNEINTSIKELRESIKNLGHKSCVINEKKTKGAKVYVSSIKIVKLITENVGKYAKNKILSLHLVWQSSLNSLKFLGSYFNGDGCQHNSTRTNTILSCSSASYQMIRQIQVMLSRCGIVSSFVTQNRKDSRKGFHDHTSYELRIGKNFSNILTPFTFFNKVKEKRLGQLSFIKSGYVFYPIRKISRLNFSGTVYNLEIEDDHSYLVNGVAVHNCFGTGYLGGYQGPYDVTIAPPEAEKSIELLDMGLRINYEYESWTGAFPMIRERDVVVRQNNERYVIGPVNYQGSRGATYQQHFRMSYVDEKDIRYKIGIPGGETQVPEDWDRYRSGDAGPTPASPERPVKPEIDKAKLVRGRTVTFENISY